MQSASQDEMQKNMEKLFLENIDLKHELKELKTLANEMQKTLDLSYRFTKSLTEIATNYNPNHNDKDYIVRNEQDFNLTI